MFPSGAVAGSDWLEGVEVGGASAVADSRWQQWQQWNGQVAVVTVACTFLEQQQ